jgi:TonB family protein
VSLASATVGAVAQQPDGDVAPSVSRQCELENLEPRARFSATTQESVAAAIRRASTCVAQSDAACADAAISSVQTLALSEIERALLAIPRGELAALRGDSAAAVGIYRDALSAPAITVAVLRELTWRLAAVLNTRGEFSETLRLLASIECDRWTAEALALRAVAYQNIGARALAVEDFEAAMRLYELEGRALPAAFKGYYEALLAAETPEPIPGTDIVPLVRLNPDYPERALRRGNSGWVQLQFDITDNGAVENVRVVTSTNEIFEQPSIAAVQRWRYVPKLENGLPLGRAGEQTVLTFCLEPCNWRGNPPPQRGPDGRYPEPPAAP